jgi:tetratricopeptide (TPR) repeat protein
MTVNGWQQLWVPSGREGEAVAAVQELEQPCVIVVDYAETRDGLTELLSDAVRDVGGPDTRVILLARGSGEWWRRLVTGVDERVARVLAAPPVALGPISAEGGPGELFSEALTAFAEKLGVDRPDTRLVLANPEPVVLVVHAAALLAVLDSAFGTVGDQAHSETEVLAGLLAHEGRYWAQSAASRGLDLDVALQRQAVMAGCLIGAGSEPSATELLSRIPDLADSAERRGKVARWLRDLYPQAGGEEWIGPLRPDPVAEHLVVTELNDRPDLIPKLFTGLTGDRAARALTVLARAAYAQPPALHLLRAALTADLEHLAIPALAVAVETNPALGQLLSEVLQARQVSTALLKQIANVIPYPSLVLAGPAATVLRQLIDNSNYAEERASRLVDLSNRLGDLGQGEESLVAIQQAVAFYRQLAQDNPDTFLPQLARSLTNESGRLGLLRQREKALAAAQEAVSIFGQLVRERPGEFLDHFANSLNNESNALGVMELWQEGLTAAKEAERIYRQLAREHSSQFLPHLATALSNKSRCLAALGQREDALTAIEETIAIRYQLAEDYPDAFMNVLAESLANQARRLGDLGRWDEALAAIEEAVSLNTRLAQIQPRLYDPELSRLRDQLVAILRTAAAGLQAATRYDRADRGQSLTALGKPMGDRLWRRLWRRAVSSMRRVFGATSGTWTADDLMHHGLLIAVAYLRQNDAEKNRLIKPFLKKGRFGRLADAFTYVAILATEIIATGRGKPFQRVLRTINERTDVSLIPEVPTGPWQDALLLASTVKRSEEEARGLPLTMDVPSAINVMFRLAISAITDMTKVPEFAHMTPLAVAEMLTNLTEKASLARGH